MRLLILAVLVSFWLPLSASNSQEQPNDDRAEPKASIGPWDDTRGTDRYDATLGDVEQNTAQPTTILIVPGIYQTIQSAIYAAGEGDTVLVQDGVYTGFGNKDLYFYGRNIVLMSEHGPDLTIIDCEGAGRGINITTAQDSTTIIEGFTIKNGNVVDESGGGIFIEYASPTFVNCFVDSNFTNRLGGGVYVFNSEAVFEECKFRRNHATWSGGGAHCGEALAEFVECEFAFNETYETGGGMAGSANMTDCQIVGNTAWTEGGGLSLIDGTFTRCTIEGNISALDGGGVAVAGSAVLEDCRIVGNDADYGGGIKVYPRSGPSFNGCVITGNRGQIQGGGIALHIRDVDTPVFTNCSIAGNKSGTGGGGGVHVYSTMGGALVVPFERTIVWGNCSAGPGDAVYVTCTSSGTGVEFTCCDVDSSGLATNGCGTISFLADNLFDNPLFCELPECDLAPTTTGDCRLDGVSPCLASNSPCLQLVGAIDSTCTGTGIEDGPEDPRQLLVELSQNYPNPFNPSTTISFTLNERAETRLTVYNIEGMLVTVLVEETLGAGARKITWNGTDGRGNRVSTGVYFYRLTAGDKTLTKKMVLLK